MDRCELLKEYSEFIGNGILKDFLTNNRNEVRSMSLFEFDAEEHEKAIKQIAYEEGLTVLQRVNRLVVSRCYTNLETQYRK